jgi:hypothetical protein
VARCRSNDAIDDVCVDPSAGEWWGVEWWSLDPASDTRSLIRGLRSKTFRAGDLLEERDGILHGVMETWTRLSVELSHPIRAWVVEGNNAFAAFTHYAHFATWQRKWSGSVAFILHKTGLTSATS